MDATKKLQEKQSSLKRLREEVSLHETTIEKLLQKLESELYPFFELTPDGSKEDFRTRMNQVMENEKCELSRVKQEMDMARDKKVKAITEVTESNDRFDGLKKRLKDLEDEEKRIEESTCRTSYKTLAHLMLTKFELDRDKRCVSLILNNEQRVERAALIDKENTPEHELRQTMWDKFNKMYNNNN